MERVTLGLIREVSSYLKESRFTSGLRSDRLEKAADSPSVRP
jgi:hypothetical protein